MSEAAAKAAGMWVDKVQDISEASDGDRVNMPVGVLYTLSVTDQGEASAWASDRLERPDQFAWLHGIVTDAAQALVGSAAGPSGLN